MKGARGLAQATQANGVSQGGERGRRLSFEKPTVERVWNASQVFPNALVNSWLWHILDGTDSKGTIEFKRARVEVV
ncbi:hypothetical protein Q31a_40740 [Aureliella helgolandensis]|uniref:Uncharacterized protein n=1 Tax=Aureliella helgolandensis TaxID=2527968 RepID=A0A518GB23_9BACT|nr:hypothetical protein Q31a_40740 [Aureliella helgolandensis]